MTESYAEICEASRSALQDLVSRGNLAQKADINKDWVMVACIARFGNTPKYFEVCASYETKKAAKLAAAWANCLAIQNCAVCGEWCKYYELWHVVDDSTDFSENETNAIMLPLDRYDLPLHVGDKVYEVNDNRTYKVSHMAIDPDGWWVYVSDDGSNRFEWGSRPERFVRVER